MSRDSGVAELVCVRGVGTGKSVLAGRKGSGGQLGRAASSRKTARSDYEEQRIMLQLQAVERMKEMVQARPLMQAPPSLHPPYTEHVTLMGPTCNPRVL